MCRRPARSRSKAQGRQRVQRELIETPDDLSGYVGRELIGVHTFETLQVKDGASVDFGGDRVLLLDPDQSDLIGELLNVDVVP